MILEIGRESVECPLELIDQIGGWRSVSSIGAGYGQGYSIEQLFKQIAKIQMSKD